MAAAVTSQTINNGPKNLTVKLTIEGTTGDLSAGTAVDVSAIDSSIGVNDLSLVSVDWAFTGFSAALLWDATTDVELIYLHDGEGAQDFTKVGGIKNNAGSGATGDVNITTTGYTASGDGGHAILRFRKT